MVFRVQEALCVASDGSTGDHPSSRGLLVNIAMSPNQVLGIIVLFACLCLATYSWVVGERKD